MIISFKDKETQRIWVGFYSKKLPFEIQRTSKRKLIHIHSAIKIDDLRAPIGNRLEKLKGERKKQYSIIINDRWRICFNWKDGNAYDVEIVDYHN